MQIKSLVQTLVKALIAAGLIYWMISKGLLDLNIFQIIWDPVFLPLCFALVFSNLFFATVRWFGLLKSAGLDMSFLQCFKLAMIGVFFNFAVPGGVGGDVVKAFYTVRNHPENRWRAGMSILMDRLLGLFAMLLLAMSIVVWNYPLALNSPKVFFLFLSVVAVFVAFIFIGMALFSRRVRNHKLVIKILDLLPGQTFENLYDTVQFYLRNRRVLFNSVILSLLAQTSAVLMFVAVGYAMGETLPLGVYFFAVPLGFIAMALPIAPAGIGVGQAAYAFLFLTYLGEQSNVGANAVTVFQVIQLCLSFTGAAFYLQQRDTQVEKALSHG